jgi:phage terminase Nu1 subunit (DNA packaging protein)
VVRRYSRTATVAPSAGRDWTSVARQADVQGRWLHDHLDDGLAEWQVRRGARLVEPGRLAPEDLAWAQLQRLRPQLQVLLDDLLAYALDEPGRALAGRLSTQIAACLRTFDALLQHVDEAGTDVGARPRASHDLELARSELEATLSDLAAGLDEATTVRGRAVDAGHPAPSPAPSGAGSGTRPYRWAKSRYAGRPASSGSQ